MSSEFFSDWAPGVLSDTQLRDAVENGWLLDVKDTSDATIDYSSIDLTLSEVGYELPFGAIKPFERSYEHFISKEKALFVRLESKDGTFTLYAKKTYLFRLVERIGPDLKSSGLPIYGQATAKSSVGRVDVLARLIVDGMDAYESFESNKASGALFLEITPITFNVRVKRGISLSQLRLFYGSPNNVSIRGKELFNQLLIKDGGDSDGSLSVDLASETLVGHRICGFKAKYNREIDPPIDLWKAEPPPDPTRFWQLKRTATETKKTMMQIEKNAFYILRSKEKMALPRGICVYCRAIDETIGEMRIHYAGFVHPFFGRDRTDGETGTPLIFEVRGHDVQVLLNDGEKMARLEFYRMSQDCKLRKPSDYSDQILKLSKFFGDWPEKMSLDNNDNALAEKK